jgi:hypothetical protein
MRQGKRRLDRRTSGSSQNERRSLQPYGARAASGREIADDVEVRRAAIERGWLERWTPEQSRQIMVRLTRRAGARLRG